MNPVWFFSDYEDFLEDLEEDKDYRSAINIYRGKIFLCQR